MHTYMYILIVAIKQYEGVCLGPIPGSISCDQEMGTAILCYKGSQVTGLVCIMVYSGTSLNGYSL